MSAIPGSIRLRSLFLLTFLLVAALPAGFLAIWAFQTNDDREREASSNKQLEMAVNFSQNLATYAKSARAVFDMYAKDYFDSRSIEERWLTADMVGFDCFFAIVPLPNGSVDIDVAGKRHRVRPETISMLKEQATAEAQFFPVRLDADDKPMIYLARRSLLGTVFVGALNTSDFVARQRLVAFGSHGHAVVVDQTGRVLAHPNESWEREVKDLSHVAPVQRLLAGEAGATEFFAPARQENAIAGFAPVTSTGWGVLMVRPTAEVEEAAASYTFWALITLAAAAALACGVAFMMARVLVRPIENVAETARQLENGIGSARVDPVPQMPDEVRELSTTLNRLAERIDGWRHAAADTLSAVRASDQAKNDFMATLSHEMRTPLNAIVGFSDMLQESIKRDPHNHRIHEEYADHISSASQHLWGLVEEILDLAAIEAGHIELNPKPVDLATIVAEAAEMLVPAAEQNEIETRLDFPAALPKVIADGVKLRQVLLNLLGNAIKFTPKGGAIEISATVNSNHTVAFTVCDTGIGMSKDDMEIALQPFGRVKRDMGKTPKGSGLGLPLAKRLVETMNGKLELDSELRRGTCVTVTLPMA